MRNFDDILGAQQDQLAEYSFQLLQLTQNCPEFKDCTTPFEVFFRIQEIVGSFETRKVLTNYVRGIHTEIRDIDAWVDRLLSSLDHKNAAKFNAVSENAILSTLGAGPA